MPRQAFCPTDTPVFDKPFEGHYWNGWGVDLHNRRSQPGTMAGIQQDQVSRLKLKWAFGVPGVTVMLAQPTVAGGRVFFGSDKGKVYSVDAASGCVYWVFDAGARVRTAITLGPIGDRWAAYFGDQGTNGSSAYAVDAATGVSIWKTTVDNSVYSNITGAPVLADGKLYVPVTGHEDALASMPGFECCKFRGSLVALDAQTGKQIWKSYTIAESARPTRKNSQGVQEWGPSGAGIWSAPTVDLAKRTIYTATGDSHSGPAAGTSDSILAFDMDTGAMRWSRQMTPGDAWNAACVQGDPANCPEEHGLDLDFGSSPLLVDRAGGKRTLIAGQKSGVVYALDPDREGKVLWQTRIGRGGFVGGIQWGPAADAENIYVALSDMPGGFPPSLRAPDLSLQGQAYSKFDRFWARAKKHFPLYAGGGTFALRISSGERVWYTPPQCEGGPNCNPAQVAAVTHIPGVVFSGSADGHLRAYATDDGHIIWNVNTARAYAAVNGVKASGGSIQGPGPVVVGGVLYANSGYFGQPEANGNVLLAFSVDGK
jgi:polyvinyl alcohol dehydrogenase (cytochrome)